MNKEPITFPGIRESDLAGDCGRLNRNFQLVASQILAANSAIVDLQANPGGGTTVINNNTTPAKGYEAMTITAGAVTPDGTSKVGHEVTLDAASTDINAIAGPDAGELHVFVIIQDHTGGRAYVWGAEYLGLTGIVPSTSPDLVTTYVFEVQDASHFLLVAYIQNISEADTVSSVTADTTLSAGPEIVDTDTTGGDVTITLPDPVDMLGQKKTIYRSSADGNSTILDGAGSDTIDGVLTQTMTGQWASLTIEAVAAGKWKIVSAAVSSTPPTPTAPDPVTVGTITYRYSPGKKELILTVPYTAPSPIGVFEGVHAYIEYPDQSADASLELNGTTALNGTFIAGGEWEPIDIGDFTYTAGEPAVITGLGPPSAQVNIRVYLTSYSSDVHVALTRNGLAGATPSAVVTVDPPGPDKPSSGIEYADLITDYAVSKVVKVVGGVSTTYVYVTYTAPDDAKFSGIYHHVQYYTAEGDLTDNVGVIWDGSGSGPSNIFVTPPTQSARTFALSYSNWDGQQTHEDQVNNYVYGVTPESTLALGNTVGSVGTEYADDVTDLAVTVEQKVEGGQMKTYVYTSFTPPADPRWYGVYVRVTYQLDNGDFTTNQGVIQDPSGSDTSNIFATPNLLQTATIEARSYSVIEGTDSVNTAGPSTTATIGIATGSLDFTKAIEGSFDSAEFQVSLVGGVPKWNMKSVDFTKASHFSSQFEVSTGAFRVKEISADLVVTGRLQVGGPGMISQMKVFDTVGNLIGWVGDDSGVSGYVGAWFKRILIGGTSPASAKIIADANGNIFLNGFLISSSILTGTLIIGGSGATVPNLQVYNSLGSLITWIGQFGTDYGLWSKSLWAGGFSAGTAPFKVDSTGRLSITMDSSTAGTVPFQLTSNNVETSITNSFDGYLSDYSGLKVRSIVTGSYAAFTPNKIGLFTPAANNITASLTSTGSGLAMESALSLLGRINFGAPSNSVLIRTGGGVYGPSIEAADYYGNRFSFSPNGFSGQLFGDPWSAANVVLQLRSAAGGVVTLEWVNGLLVGIS